MAPVAPSTASSRAATGRSPSLSLERIASTVDVPSIHWISRQITRASPKTANSRWIRRTTVQPGWRSTIGSATGKAETDRPLVVHPGAHPQQRRTYVAGHGIRLSDPPDEPSLTRAVDEQIRSEDVVGADVFVKRDLEVLPAPLPLEHPAAGRCLPAVVLRQRSALSYEPSPSRSQSGGEHPCDVNGFAEDTGRPGRGACPSETYDPAARESPPCRGRAPGRVHRAPQRARGRAAEPRDSRARPFPARPGDRWPRWLAPPVSAMSPRMP